MKNRSFWLQFGAVLAFLGIAAVILPIFFASDRTPRYSRCQSNLKQIGLALAQYTQDYNEKFPIVTTKQGWFGALQPYLKSTALFRCPSEKLQGDDNLTDYWFNQRLAGVEVKILADAGWTLMSGDGEASDDPNISLTVLPPLWSKNKDSPARRHLDGANYLFADGHVKAFKPEQITLDKPSAGRPTFLVR